MSTKVKLAALAQIYRVLRDALDGRKLDGRNLFCHQGCATCCTLNVTMTTLEGYQLISHLIQTKQANLLDQVPALKKQSLFRPKLTINALAQHCINNIEPSEEESDPAPGVCPFLRDNICAVYAVRPLACRTMVSTVDCRETGYASMDPFKLSMNNVLMQFTEHIDQDGLTGNLTDVLTYLSNENNRDDYQLAKHTNITDGLITNRPLTVLMIPPEHRQLMVPLLKALNPNMGDVF